MKRFLWRALLGLWALFLPAELWAKDYTLSGYVRDEESGETLISATVYDKVSGKGTVTNQYGYYSLTLSGDSVHLIVNYLGFTPYEQRFRLSSNQTVSVSLSPNAELDEIVVTGRENLDIGVKGAQMSTVEIPVGQIKTLPTLFGEADVLKAIQLMPGVQTGSEGSSGMYVRGGGPDENLMLLDGVPVYNVSHAGGFFSVFNPDAIKNVTLYKGNFPARFGGRLSSVIDVRMKDGNNQKLHGNVSVGLVSSRIGLEGPLFNPNTTFNVSFRRTYSDLISKPVLWYLSSSKQADLDKLSAGYYFYDFNAKVSHRFSDRDRLYFSWYSGDDGMYAKVKASDVSADDYSSKSYLGLDTKWGNMVGALRWNHVLGPKLFLNTTASYTRYRFSLGVSADSKTTSSDYNYEESIAMTFKSGIEDYTLKADLEYNPVPSHSLKMGLNFTYHTFRPGVSVLSSHVSGMTEPLDTTYGDANIYSHELMAYAEDNFDVGDYVKFNAGLHYSAYWVDSRFYHSLQPRLGLRILAGERLSFKLGYAKMNQYVHMLSNSSISLPTDLWVPVTRRITPMNSHQFSGGVFYNLLDKVDLSIEAYYKRMNNLIEYKDGASFLDTSTEWQEKVCMGRGWSYGVEFLAQKSFGKTTGWIGYTWSKSERLFDREGEMLNNGKVFPAKYDRRHDLSVTVSHRFAPFIDASATWVYNTGNCGTLAFQQYSVNGETIDYISERNNYRLPDYMRLDLGVNFHRKHRRFGESTWNIGVYNATNRKNPYMVYTQSQAQVVDGKMVYTTRLVKLSVFVLIPSVSYEFKF